MFGLLLTLQRTILDTKIDLIGWNVRYLLYNYYFFVLLWSPKDNCKGINRRITRKERCYLSLHIWLITKLGFYVKCSNITCNKWIVKLLKGINEGVINVNETEFSWKVSPLLRPFLVNPISQYLQIFVSIPSSLEKITDLFIWRFLRSSKKNNYGHFNNY